MTVFTSVYSRLKRFVWSRRRIKRCKGKAELLTNPDVSILSMNCTGGILYHDLGLPFLSPTVNLFFQAEDFIRFCERLEDYLAIDDMTECKEPAIVEGRTYPVAWLGDIKLFLVHYASVAEAQEAWNKRKKRLARENIAVIATDRDGMTDALKDRFEKLPYQKVMFVHRPDAGHPSCFFLRGWEEEDAVGIITEPTGWRGLRPIDQFDWIGFLNGAVRREKKTA